MSSRPLDTAPGAWSRYETVLDRMDGPARLRAAVELSDAVHEIRLAGVRSRQPDLRLRDAVAQLVAENHGVALPRQK